MIIPAYKANKKDIEGLVKKGLLEAVGVDPSGRTIYKNTQLGNFVADELEKQDMFFKPEYDDENEELDADEINLGFDDDDLEDEDDRDYDDEY
jgi:hypothetical protein